MTTALTVALSLTALAQPASARPVWTPPAVLGADGSEVTVAANASGDEVATWVRAPSGGGAALVAAFRPAGSAWGRARVVSTDVPDRSTGPRAVIDGAGRATVVWSVVDPGPNGWLPTAAIRASSANSGSTWSNPTLLVERADVDPGPGFGLTVDGSGSVTVAWPQYDGCGFDTGAPPPPCAAAARDDLYTATSSPAGAWSTPTLVAPGAADAGASPAVAAAADGSVTLVAFRADSYFGGSRSGELVAARRPAGGSWTTPATLGSTGIGSRPQVAVSADGTATAAWTACDSDATGSPCRVETATADAAGSWGASEVRASAGKSVGGYTDSDQDVAVAASGAESTVVWRLPADGAPVTSARRTASGWQPPVVLATPATGVTLSNPVAAGGRAAGTVAAWLATRTTGARQLVAAVRPAGADWQPPAVIRSEAPGPRGSGVDLQPAVAVIAARDTAVMSSARGALWSDRVEDTTAPSAAMTSPVNATATGTRVRVAWRATDTQAGVATTTVRMRTATWRGTFGGWSTWPSRTTTRAAYLRVWPGRTSCFEVRAIDRAGLTGRWSRPRCTTAPVDDRSLHASAGWRRTTAARAYRRTETTTSGHGRRLTLPHARVRRLSLVAATGPRGGMVTVKIGRMPTRWVSLRSSTVHHRRVLRVASYRVLRSGTVTVRVVSSGRPVRIDGVVLAH